MNIGILIADVIGWPVLQLGMARLFVLLPDRFFSAEANFYRERVGEDSLYRHVLRIRKWKGLLPDGGQWVGSKFPKRRIIFHDRARVDRFILETRRGEAAHWAVFLVSPVFYLWNPGWACAVVTLYAMLTNFPCIAVQRYNRFIFISRARGQI